MDSSLIKLKFSYLLFIFSLVLCFLYSGKTFASEALVSNVRVAMHGEGTITRIVFDFTKKLPYNIFFLTKPDRLVIDLPEVGWQLPPKPLPSEVGVFENLRYGLNKPGNSRIVFMHRFKC